jgi:hypothetical protein
MGRMAWAAIAVIAGFLFASPALPQSAPKGGPTPSPPGAKVEFIDLRDGALIGPKTTIHFGLHGMGVAPAGTKRPNSGHHHLLIDTDLPPLDQPIPNDENHLHFGGGQTEVELALPPGPHTLQLLLGDADHIPHNPPIYSDKIHVTVAESAPAPAPTAQSSPSPGTRHPSPPGARVYIVSPENGAYVPTTFTVRFGLEKMGVAPAGVDKPNSGHHHLLIDAELPPLDKPIPNDENLAFRRRPNRSERDLAEGPSYPTVAARGRGAHPPRSARIFQGGCGLCRHVAASGSTPSAALLFPRARVGNTDAARRRC